MNQFDLLLRNSLAALAGETACLTETGNVESLEFGTVAFFKENSWKLCTWHQSSCQKRSSHPGLSIATGCNQIAFGSSKIADRDPKTTLIASSAECSILKRPTAFLLQYSAPLNVFDIDFRKTATAKISQKLELQLQRKLANV